PSARQGRRVRGTGRVPPAVRERASRDADRRLDRRRRRGHRRDAPGPARMKLTRVPIESPAPVAWFGVLRIAIAVSAFVSVLVFDVPDRAALLVLSGAVAIPWAIAVRLVVRSRPQLTLHPLIAVVDLLILAVDELVVPEAYAGVCFLVVFLVAAHAHFQGPQLGVGIALLAIAIFVPIAALGAPPVSGALLAFYEVLFAAS